MSFIVSWVLSYLIGSISSAVILAKWFGLPDPRTQGSGNAGATNMARVAGKSVGMYVLLADGLKGLIVVIIARALHLHGASLAFVVFLVVLGHIYPVFFQFKGGKGVATLLGAILGLSFWTGAFLIVTWLIIAIVFRYSSLASLITVVASPIYLLIAGYGSYFFPIVLAALLIIFKHWENITRLRAGTEHKLNFK